MPPLRGWLKRLASPANENLAKKKKSRNCYTENPLRNTHDEVQLMRKVTIPRYLAVVAVLFVLGFVSWNALTHSLAQQATEPPKGWGGLSDPLELKSLKYRSIGPAWGGRVSRAAG